MAEKENQIRLYSRKPRVPEDIVEPQHQDVHGKLDRWGRWQREKYEPATCASIEKLYTKGGDTTPPATAPQPLDPVTVAVDQAVRLLRRRVPDHAEALRLYYVGADGRRPMEPKLICRRLGLHWSHFRPFMSRARAMAINVLKELDFPKENQ